MARKAAPAVARKKATHHPARAAAAAAKLRRTAPPPRAPARPKRPRARASVGLLDPARRHATVFDAILVIMVGSVAARALTGGAPYFPSLSELIVLVFLHWVMSALARRSGTVAG